MAYFGGTTSGRPWPKVDIKFLVLFIIAFAGLMLSIFLGKDLFISSTPKTQETVQSAPAVASTQVLVTNSQIQAGKLLTPDMFTIEQRAFDSVDNAAIRQVSGIEGKYARVNMDPGTVLVRDFLTNDQPKTHIMSHIPPGFRAVAIPVNVVTGVEGWVQPGARVDVVWSTVLRGSQIVTTIVENARVLSAERSMEAAKSTGDKPVPNHITLLVTSKDAQKIQLAKNSGSLSLSLRGDQDGESSGSETLSTEALIGNRDSMRAQFQGKVRFDGQDFVMRGGRMIPAKEDEAAEKEKPQY